jgi:HAD superfamily hydrolase (TIGR01484 family)
MTLPIQLISTDFDGTLFAEYEQPPIPKKLQVLLGDLQARGVKWVINTGRDMSSLMEALARARLSVQPDYLVLVEREIHVHDGVRYVGLEAWNTECTRSHEELFARVRPDLPRLAEWINSRFNATLYEDAYSPFCLIAGNNNDAEVIHEYLQTYSQSVAQLAIVRNNVYSRMSHSAFNKGTALAELTRRLGCSAAEVLAVGDHFNDLPMLTKQYAGWLAAPQNAIDAVKAAVTRQSGYVSKRSHGNGVAEAIVFHLQDIGR